MNDDGGHPACRTPRRGYSPVWAVVSQGCSYRGCNYLTASASASTGLSDFE